ncbi:MAG: hypothetical protein WCT03_03760 [Candidatus Obscuribacterales bacterium]
MLAAVQNLAADSHWVGGMNTLEREIGMIPLFVVAIAFLLLFALLYGAHTLGDFVSRKQILEPSGSTRAALIGGMVLGFALMGFAIGAPPALCASLGMACVVSIAAAGALIGYSSYGCWQAL